MIPVADHHAASAFTTRIGLGYVGVDFGLQGGGQHPPRTLAEDVANQGASLGRSIGIHYAQHGRAFPNDGATSAYSMTRSRSLGKVRPASQPEADPQVMSIARYPGVSSLPRGEEDALAVRTVSGSAASIRTAEPSSRASTTVSPPDVRCWVPTLRTVRHSPHTRTH